MLDDIQAVKSLIYCYAERLDTGDFEQLGWRKADRLGLLAGPTKMTDSDAH